MTKTHRRLAARARRDARDAAVPLDYATATKLLNDHNRWTHLREALRGLIEIEFTSPFIDRELKCPEQAHIIVHLDRLQIPDISTSPLPFQWRVARTLDDVAMLCATAKRLSPWSGVYHRFWGRVCDTDVLVKPLQPSEVDKWVRYTKARGIRLLLSWSDKPFDPDQLMEPLRAFLSTPQPASCKTTDVPVTVGLRFLQATLTTSVLESLYELLIKPTEEPDALLIDPTSLRTLWVNSNPLNAPELSVLASILADPRARRVDELNLENFVVKHSPGTALPAFSVALSQVLASAVATRNEGEPALSLSLAENTFTAEHLDLTQEALAQATRPVCALSLSKIKWLTQEAWTSLVGLLFRPLPAATRDAVLNLSGVGCFDEISTNVSLLVQGFIESLWSRSVDVEEKVECCFRHATLYENPGDADPLSVAVHPHTFYAIEGYFAPTRSLQITVLQSTDSGATESESISGWINASSATQLRVDGLDVVGSSFTRVIYDSAGPHDWCACLTALELTSVMGSRLKALSFRENHSTGNYCVSTRLLEIISWCPQLNELSVEGAQLTAHGSPPFWDNHGFTLPASIRVLNLSRCGLSDVSLQGLEKFPLQYLSLLSNPIGPRGVESLLAMLGKNKQLQLVELNPQFSEPSALCIGLRSQIDEMLRREYLHAQDKAAMLSVLTYIQRRDPLRAYPGDGVVALVFAFAGTKPKQAVQWKY